MLREGTGPEESERYKLAANYEMLVAGLMRYVSRQRESALRFILEMSRQKSVLELRRLLERAQSAPGVSLVTARFVTAPGRPDSYRIRLFTYCFEALAKDYERETLGGASGVGVTIQPDSVSR